MQNGARDWSRVAAVGVNMKKIKPKISRSNKPTIKHTHCPSDRQQELFLLRRFLHPGTQARLLQRSEPLLLHALVGASRHLGLHVHELVVGRAGGVGPQLDRA